MKAIKISLVVLLMTSAFVTKGLSQKDSSHPKAKQESFNQPVQLTNFLKKNPMVANVHWKSDNDIILKLKNGVTQMYKLNDENERKTFENKYGTPPVAPPPPPSLEKRQSK